MAFRTSMKKLDTRDLSNVAFALHMSARRARHGGVRFWPPPLVYSVGRLPGLMQWYAQVRVHEKHPWYGEDFGDVFDRENHAVASFQDPGDPRCWIFRIHCADRLDADLIGASLKAAAEKAVWEDENGDRNER